MTRLPILIRQSKTFDLVVAGHSYTEICAELGVSEDTVARDMQAIGDQVQEVARKRLGEVVAVALATYQRVIDHAWAEYERDREREQRWYAGEMDYEADSVNTTTLALEEEEGPDGKPKKGNRAAQLAKRLFPQESQPIEVKRSQRTVRPALRGEGRSRWLQVIVDTTREMTELLGIKKLIVEHQGKDGGPIEMANVTAEERAARVAALLDKARKRAAEQGDR
jgi:hypothetical protein